MHTCTEEMGMSTDKSSPTQKESVEKWHNRHFWLQDRRCNMTGENVWKKSLPEAVVSLERDFKDRAEII